MSAQTLQRQAHTALNSCIEAPHAMLGVERPDAVGTRVCRMTDPLLGPFKRIVPALIYRIERAPE